jgi:hypothetical protein
VDEQERREAVRRAYEYRCGYCGVHEQEAGSELEIDHFQPRSLGGGDDLDNLVYCCSTCNRLKGNFWPTDDPSITHRRLLHPKRDDLAMHLREEAGGRLIALTETGAFHIARLRLNRPPLVALRRARQESARLRRELAEAREERVHLRERIAVLERELEEVLAQLTRLLGP